LHPDLEIAAVVIQLPFAKRESLKYKRGDKGSDKMHSNLLNLSVGEQRMKTIRDEENQEKVKVVIPTGKHSLPRGDGRGPSSLLDRWRSDGGCDCGGWDMACPLTVFGNPGIQCAEDEPLLDNQRPLELFLQVSFLVHTRRCFTLLTWIEWKSYTRIKESMPQIRATLLYW
jgi:hypothetical protein